MNMIEGPDLFSSVMPINPRNYSGKNVLTIVACQLCVSIISSICLSYYAYKKFHKKNCESWKAAAEIMTMAENRLQNLEKERIVWNSYLEWVEEYCTIYCGLLNYINVVVKDLHKFHRKQSISVDITKDISNETFPNSICESSKGGHVSNAQYDMGCDDEIVGKFTNIFFNFKLRDFSKSVKLGGSRGNERYLESVGSELSDLDSGTERNLESGQEDLESQGPDEGLSYPENFKTLYSKKPLKNYPKHPDEFSWRT